MQLSAQKIRRYRESKGWSQEVLAKATGLSLRTIQRIEAEKQASGESVLAIASALEVLPNQLQSANDEIQVYWTRSMLMTGAIVITAILATLIALVNMVSDIRHYLDVPALMFMFGFTTLFSLLSFGTSGLKKVTKGLKYMFAREVIGGASAKALSQLYARQITYFYASAVLLLLIGTIATIKDIAVDPSTANLLYLLENILPVLILPFLYAVIINEAMLRPLKHKLELHADQSLV